MSGNKRELFRRLFCKEIAVMNGADFEYFCFPFFKFLARKDFSTICGNNFNHVGHNSESKSVGYSVDFVDDNYVVIGQCTAELDVFTSNTSAKLLKDVDGSIKNNPKLKVIFIFSNQQPGSRVCDRFSTELILYGKEKYGLSLIVKIFDARLLSDIAFENKHERDFRDVLNNCVFYEEYDFEKENINNVPYNVSCFIDRLDFYEEIQVCLDEKSVVQIYGPSGIGKTELIKGFLRNRFTEFSEFSVLWFDMSNVKDLNDLNLSAIKHQSGYIDLLKWLNVFKVIVVFDSFNLGTDFLDVFNLNNKNKSKLILTSNLRTISDCSICMTSFDHGDVKRLLSNLNIGGNLDYILEQVFEKTKGYPLLVYMLVRSVQEGDFDWDDVKNFSENDLLNLTVPNGEDEKLRLTLMNKIFSKIKDDLKYIYYIGSGMYSYESIIDIMGLVSVGKLLKRGIMMKVDGHYCKVHDFIIKSIHNLAIFDKDEPPDWVVLIDFVWRMADGKPVEFYRFMRIHFDFLLQLIDKDLIGLSDKRRLMCAISQYKGHKYVKNNERNYPALFQEDNGDYYYVLLRIELIECQLAFENKNFSREIYKNSCAEYYEWILALDTSNFDESQRSNLHFHAGKFLARRHEYFQAIAIFDQYSNDPFVMLQKARALSHQKNEGELLVIIARFFEEFCAEPNLEKAPLTVVMGFVELMAKGENYFAVRSNSQFDIKRILILIRECVDFGLEQHLKTSFTLARCLFDKVNDNIMFFDIFRDFCKHNDFDRFDLNSLAYVSFLLLTLLLLCGCSDDSSELKQRWTKSVELIPNYSSDWDYSFKTVLELFLMQEDCLWYDLFIAYEMFFKDGSCYVKQKISKIYYKLGDYYEAHKYILEAIEALGDLSDSEQTRYSGAFERDRAKAELALSSL